MARSKAIGYLVVRGEPNGVRPIHPCELGPDGLLWLSVAPTIFRSRYLAKKAIAVTNAMEEKERYHWTHNMGRLHALPCYAHPAARFAKEASHD